MAIRNILQIGDDTLRKKCFEVTDFDDRLHTLLDDMRETLVKADGVGLAGPQVGVLRRVFIADAEEEGFYEFINPVIVSAKGSQTGTEGCLSVRSKWGTVTRPNKVTVKAFDRYGKPFTVVAKGKFARIICHEYDHLEGRLFVDIADSLEDR